MGGCALADLAAEFGTPLQVLDTADVDARAAEYVDALGALDRPARAVFATKALPLVSVVRRLAAHGIGADVTTAGELAVATAAGVPMPSVVQHGNARSREELAEAAAAGVGLVVLDGPQDVEHLDAVATDAGRRARADHARVFPRPRTRRWPPHTTARSSGSRVAEAPDAVPRRSTRHGTCGCGASTSTSDRRSRRLAPFVDAVRRVQGLGSFEVLDAGGGLGVPLTAGMDVPGTDAYVRALDDAMAAAGFALRDRADRRAGSVARRAGGDHAVPGPDGEDHRGPTFVAVDGGTSDDIEAVTGLRAPAPFAPAGGATRDRRPWSVCTATRATCSRATSSSRRSRPGDLVAMAGTGAYTFSLASNYNATPRPAVVEVADGHARTVVRRETVADLLARQVV